MKILLRALLVLVLGISVSVPLSVPLSGGGAAVEARQVMEGTNNLYGCVLASWQAGFAIHPDITLQGNNGSWVTIASDEYNVHPLLGAVVSRHYDDDGNAVDWSSYTSFRATYYRYNTTTGTLDGVAANATDQKSNETQTVDYLSYGISPFDPATAQLNESTAARGKYLAGDYLSLGTKGTRPASSSTGTGIWGDKTGIYGLNGGTKQFYLQVSDGKAVAGAGGVTLDADGVTIATPSSKTDVGAYKWVEGGTTKTAEISNYISGGTQNTTVFPTLSQTGKDSYAAMTVAAPTTKLAHLHLSASSHINSVNLDLAADDDATLTDYAKLWSNSLGFGLAISAGGSTITPDSLVTLKSHAGYTGSGWQHKTAAVSTTDATITTLYSKTLSDNTVYSYRVHIVARRTDTGTENGIYARQFGVYRQGGGGATLIAAADTIGTDRETTMTGTITVDVSSNDIRVRVTGQASKTIVWVCTVEWQAVSTSS